MSAGESYFWGVVAVLMLLAVLAGVDAYRLARRPAGGARFVTEDEVARVEEEAA